MTTITLEKDAVVQVPRYGDCNSQDGKGIIAGFIFNDNNELFLYVWGDINEEDPTHIINLEDAREDRRK